MLRESMRAVDGDAIESHGVIVCGAAGAPPTLDPASDDGHKAMERGLETLRNARSKLPSKSAKPGCSALRLWHYPPFDAHGTARPLRRAARAARVTTCVYGHLHGEKEWSAAVQGVRDGIRYHCVAADAVGFCPLRIDQLADV